VFDVTLNQVQLPSRILGLIYFVDSKDVLMMDMELEVFSLFESYFTSTDDRYRGALDLQSPVPVPASLLAT